MRFFRPTAAIFTLIFASLGVVILYDPLGKGVPSQPGSLLFGAFCCSLAFVLVFFLLQPIDK
jgi:hypothetical protein